MDILLNKGKCTLNIKDNFESIFDNLEGDYLVIDRKVYELHDFSVLKSKILIIDADETKKNHETLRYILNFLVSNKTRRSDRLIAVGGGVVCDIVAFAASVYKRGMKLTLVPTTIIAQADAAIGGKTGINYENIKNCVGSFYHADEITLYHGFIDTLPQKHYQSGIAELLKMGIIAEPEILTLLETRQTLPRAIIQCIKTKNQIVELDPLDRSTRQILNFGHTIGHAIEIELNITHGEAVAIGMIMESAFLTEKGYMNSSINREIHKQITKHISLSELLGKSIDFSSILQDKKIADKHVTLTNIPEIGTAELIDIEIDELAACLKQR